jgi:hypothetical protein
MSVSHRSVVSKPPSPHFFIPNEPEGCGGDSLRSELGSEFDIKIVVDRETVYEDCI